ncbi:MAG: cytochrome c biogenesis protein CcsA [Planctomycetes bacterium]|nr:cytochrome c biogenesis protein CcsA [Planctomycetota bacterium]
MAIDLETIADEDTLQPPRQPDSGLTAWDTIKQVLEPLASLRLTVVLFALSIFLILAGTFAQVDKDIWEVIGQYFRCWFAWVPFAIFFPPSFVPEMPQDGTEISALGRMTISMMQGLKWLATKGGGFYFPGGKLIGLFLAANLLSAHTVRFKAQAKGQRLWLGLGALAIGCLITWFIIAAAGDSRRFQTDPWVPYSVLWIGYEGFLALLVLGSLYATLALGSRLQKSGWFREPRETFVFGLMTTSTLILAVLTTWLVTNGPAVRPSDASMRILWQLTQGSVASVALLVGCIIVFNKRSGIVLLHSGIGLLMFYELHVAMTAVETQMNLQEGETTAFVHDIRTYELAVIDKSAKDEERVTAIPRSMIRDGEKIDVPVLPFNIEISRVLPNSHLRAASVRDKNPATAGLGVEWFAEPKKPGSGTDMDSKVDMAAAYVKLTDRATDKPIGTYLVGMLLSMSNETDSIRVGDKTYELALRPKRYYKPFQFRLIDVKKEDYIGTGTPRNYASKVHIVEPGQHVDEDKTIWMNNPLRFANETFYQSGYFQERGTGVEHTTLSVVANSGWMMPYVACMLVAIGMLAHFLMMLSRFLMRSGTVPGESSRVAELLETLGQKNAGPGHSWDRKTRVADELGIKPALKPDKVLGPTPINWPSIVAATGVVAAVACYCAAAAMPPAHKDLDYDFYRFGQIPVVQDGRVKPLDSAAYSALLAISGRTYVQIGHDKDKRRIPAIQWLAEVVSDTEAADEYEVFKVENLEVQETIGVKKREGMRYSRAEIRESEDAFRGQVKLAKEAAAKDRRTLSVYQRKVLELDEKLTIFDSLQFAFGLQRRIHGNPRQKLLMLQRGAELEKMLATEGQPVFAIGPIKKDQEWQTVSGGWIEGVMKALRTKIESNPDVTIDEIDAVFSDQKVLPPQVAAWNAILASYADSRQPVEGKEKTRPRDFNRAVDECLQELKAEPPRDVNLAKTRFEASFNHFKPFARADYMYVLAFVLGACGWLGWTQGFNRIAFWLLVLILCVHTYALVGRIYISGRPPVTNLYSSAVFIGWGCVMLGLILEMVFRLGIGNLIASVAGYATLLIADGLSVKGDTFTVLQAVLDTQFWLATHVTTITMGYATTYLAGLLGVVYVLRGVLTPSLTPSISREIYRMIYGTLCFSIFFSFVGTVLGGLWADDSWGRFWGWDPKENGALIIVLWNALVLHARWGGLVKERGMAVLAIAGNIFVSWSWWGVNELGAGLHSYGFTEGTVVKLGLFVLSQLVLIGIGLTPKHLWFSFRKPSAKPVV